MALNYNNQSLELFASALNDADRKAWQTWADAFAQEHLDNAIAWYFQGDAHARLKEWDAAAKCFDKAIDLDAKCYLALNARGVVTHAVGNTILARTFFLKATKVRQDFADAYASRGTLNVYLNSTQGERDFAAARSHSQDESPILPIIGLGCTLYGQDKRQLSREYFDSIPESSSMWLLARRNSLGVELDGLTRAVQDAAKTGMFIETLQIQLDGDKHVEVQTGQAPVGTYFADWGITGFDINLPGVTIHWGPFTPQQPTGGQGGQGGGQGGGQLVATTGWPNWSNGRHN